MSGGTAAPRKPKPPNPKVFDADGNVRLPIDPRTVGLGDTRSGHALAFKESKFRRNHTFVCTACPDSDFTGQITQSGTAGVRLLERWRNHLDASDAAPDEIHTIGSFTSTKSTTTISVTHRGYRDISSYAGRSSRHIRWVANTDWWSTSPWAIVSENSRGGRRSVLGVCGSKDVAFQKAAALLRREETRGHTVSIVADSINHIPESVSVGSLLARLITEAKAATNAGDILTAIEQFDEVLNLVPALQQCRDGLNQAFERALLSTRERADSS